MSKSLEALDILINSLEAYDYTAKVSYEGEYLAIKKELKALEIIKNKLVRVRTLIHSPNLDVYNALLEKRLQLTQEEYDLLKEVLE